MDVLQSLKDKIVELPPGEHVAGMNAVLEHIQVAFSHHSRGRTGNGDASFTDAIYRTNQAFEGGVKEAFRVLSGIDPSRKKPHEIEKFMEKKGRLSPRVLSQFTAYRKEWRNPSTHEHTLRFSESEAFMAIMNVTTFSHLLIDQMLSEFASRIVESSAPKPSNASGGRPKTISAITEAAKSLPGFANDNRFMIRSGSAVVGMLAGLIRMQLPEATVIVEPGKSAMGGYEADILVQSQEGKYAVEVKRSAFSEYSFSVQLDRLSKLIDQSDINSAVVLYLPYDAKELKEEASYRSSERHGEVHLFIP